MKKVILIVRDGWGESDKEYGNAIMAANTPNDRQYRNMYPSTILKCTGNEVGNPDTAQGGSEVGHLTLGAGRIVWQPQEMINQKIKSGEFFANVALMGAMENCKKNNSALHLCGLLSDAGVHSDIAHLYALIEMAKKNGVEKVYFHLVLDGRDVPEKCALTYLEKLETKISEIGVGKIATLVGRYYTMDRDTNWDRTEEAYKLMVEGKGFEAINARQGIEIAYKRGDKTDYYIQPTLIDRDGLVKPMDSFVWFNFRSDRSRQIAKLFVERKTAYFVGMSKYDESLSMPIAFEPETIKNNLGQVLALNDKKQIRIADTEKYA
ncbi:MAG: phosphoglycerate mutase (2,3-diphosphoglycerate-independent), partial [Candidatus Moranbacteria bacterium]|nr:phosphoglycerate mutase (2,3-diphosphoglycerate-independent) [Candidatus Moranbacteria bacterium]